MKSLEVLNQLKLKSSSLRSFENPVSSESASIKKELQFLTEMTFIYILKLLGVEDDKKLSDIILRLKKGTPFYDFVFLVHNLAKSETDFEFLTSPENLQAYRLIAQIADYYDINLLPYVNVLAKIAENKQYGLYRANDEIYFFLEEYDKAKATIDVKEFLHQFRKILKHETQNIFEQLITDDIFEIIKEILHEHDMEIQNEQTLIFYVYGLHYYKKSISNEKENILLEHIKFCVSYLSNNKEIEFHQSKKNLLVPGLDSFFGHSDNVLNSLDRFIGLLKDYCPIESIDFCFYLRENIYKSNPSVFDEEKNDFNRSISKIIRKKVETETAKLYKDIYELLPQIFICERSPNILRHNGNIPVYVFYGKNGKVLFYAFENGNKNSKPPEAHTFVKIEVLNKDKNGYVLEWRWRNINKY